MTSPPPEPAPIKAGQSHLGSPTSLLPSFPRKRESRGERRVLGRWIPASAGMTEEKKATVSPNAIASPLSRPHPGGGGSLNGPSLLFLFPPPICGGGLGWGAGAGASGFARLIDNSALGLRAEGDNDGTGIPRDRNTR